MPELISLNCWSMYHSDDFLLTDWWWFLILFLWNSLFCFGSVITKGSGQKLIAAIFLTQCLQLPASAFSSLCLLLPSWRHQWSHRCWDVVYLPLFSVWMPSFNMVVCAWPLKVEVVPLVTLELPVHPCGVKVRHQLIHVRDLRCFRLHS